MGGRTFWRCCRAKKTGRFKKLEAQRQALTEQDIKSPGWKRKTPRAMDPNALRGGKGPPRRDAARLRGHGRPAGAGERGHRPPWKARGRRARGLTDDEPSGNHLFNPEAISAMRELASPVAGRTAPPATGRRSKPSAKPCGMGFRTVSQRVPDRVTAVQAVVGLGGGGVSGRRAAGRFRRFTAALLACVMEEDNV